MFISDWSKIYTAKAAEKDLKGFKFKGPGWYMTATDTILVVAHQRTEKLFHPTEQLKDEEYTFYCWNDDQAVSRICALIQSPTRVDER